MERNGAERKTSTLEEKKEKTPTLSVAMCFFLYLRKDYRNVEYHFDERKRRRSSQHIRCIYVYGRLA